jgi:hypothetical protein
VRPLPLILSQQDGEAGGSPIRVMTVRVASGPDKVGTCQHCQMVRVRRVGWKGTAPQADSTMRLSWSQPTKQSLSEVRAIS